MGDERSRSTVAGAKLARQPARDGAGAGLAAGRTGAALRIFAGAVGAPLRPQRELGLAPPGVGGVVAADHSAASARRAHPGASGDAVSGAGGAPQPGRVREVGRCIPRVPLRPPAGWPTLRRLARRHARHARAYLCGSGAVPEDAAHRQRRGDGSAATAARAGDGSIHSRSCAPPAAHCRRSHRGR